MYISRYPFSFEILSCAMIKNTLKPYNLYSTIYGIIPFMVLYPKITVRQVFTIGSNISSIVLPYFLIQIHQTNCFKGF